MGLSVPLGATQKMSSNTTICTFYAIHAEWHFLAPLAISHAMVCCACPCSQTHLPRTRISSAPQKIQVKSSTDNHSSSCPRCKISPRTVDLSANKSQLVACTALQLARVLTYLKLIAPSGPPRREPTKNALQWDSLEGRSTAAEQQIAASTEHSLKLTHPVEGP